MGSMHLFRVLFVAVIFTYTGGQRDICLYEGTVQTTFRFSAVSTSDFSTDGACHCTVQADNATSVYLTVDFRLTTLAEGGDSTPPGDEDGHCGPLMFVGEPDSTKGFYACAARSEDHVAHHEALLKLEAGQPLDFLLQNPNDENIEHNILLNGFLASLTVRCEPTGRQVFPQGRCPCVFDKYAAGGLSDEYNDYGYRLMVGLVCAFVFLVIVIAVVVGWYFYKKRKAGEEKTLNHNDANIVENQAFEGEKTPTKTSNGPPVQRDPQVSYKPDPSLNLQMQTAPATNKGFRGSQDSGLASGVQGDMQPYATSSSLNNLNEAGKQQQQANWPPLAGQGSQTSLQNEQPMTEGEIEALYAKPGKPHSGSGGGGGHPGSGHGHPGSGYPDPQADTSYQRLHMAAQQPQQPQQHRPPPEPQWQAQEVHSPAISSEV